MTASLYLSVALLANYFAPTLREPFGAARPRLDINMLYIFALAFGLYTCLCRIIIRGTAMGWNGVREIGPSTWLRRSALLAIWLLALVLAATAGVLERWQIGPDLLWTYSWLFVPFLGVLSGHYLGASWASRQVPDQQERVRLANPDQPLQTRDELAVG